VNAGDELPPLSHTYDRLDLVRYAGASGDFNPIHWDPEAAREVGLPGVIAHGMLSMGIAARAVAAFAGDPRALKRLKVRFSAMIQPGDTLTVSGAVASVDDGRAVVRFAATNSAGERVLAKGEAELALGPGPAATPS